MTPLDTLHALAHLLDTGVPSTDAIDQALALMRDGLGAESLSLVHGDNGVFGRFSTEPAPGDLSDPALALIHGYLITSGGMCGLRVENGRVSDFGGLRERRRRDCIAALLPTRRNATQMLVARGCWPRGAGGSRTHFLKAAAPVLALLLERRLNLAEAERQQYQLGALVNVGRALKDGGDLEAALTDVARTIATVAAIDYVSIDIVDAQGAVVLRCMSYGAPRLTSENRWARGRERQDPVRDAVIASRQPMIFADAQTDPRVPDSGRNFFTRSLIRSAAVFPLLAADEPVGILAVASHRPRTVPEADQQLFEGFAGQVGTAIRAVQLYEQRVMAEEALRESEARYRAIFENVQDIFYQTDMAGTIIEVSPSVGRFGYRREDLIGTSVLDIYESPETRAEFVRQMLADWAVEDYEIRLKNANGGVLDASVSAHVIRGADGAPCGFEGSIRDITGRKRAEDALRRSEERFRSLVQNASDLISVIDSDAFVLYASPAVERVLGYEAAKVLGRSLWSVIYEEDAPAVRSFIAELTHRQKTKIEARFRHLDGTWRPLEIIGTDRR